MVDESKKKTGLPLPASVTPVEVVHSEKPIQTTVEFKVTKSDVVDMIMIDEEMRLDELIESLHDEKKSLNKKMHEAEKKYGTALTKRVNKEVSMLKPMAKEVMGAEPTVRTSSQVQYFIEGPGEHRSYNLDGVVVVEAKMTKKKRIEASGYTEEEYKEFEENRYYGNGEERDFYVLIPVKRKVIDDMPETKVVKDLYHKQCKNNDALQLATKDKDLLVNKSRKAKAKITKTLLEQDIEGTKLLNNIRNASKGLLQAGMS